MGVLLALAQSIVDSGLYQALCLWAVSRLGLWSAIVLCALRSAGTTLDFGSICTLLFFWSLMLNVHNMISIYSYGLYAMKHASNTKVLLCNCRCRPPMLRFPIPVFQLFCYAFIASMEIPSASTWKHPGFPKKLAM